MARARLPLTAALSAFAVLALSSCSTPGGDTGDGAAPTDVVLTSVVSTDPTGFDPATARAGDDYTVDRLLYDSLLRRDADGTLVGGIASDWEAISATEYQFTIREDATCSDGTSLTAAAVADSLNYFASPETASNFRTLTFGPGQATATADDGAGTVAVTLTEPYALVLDGLALAQSGIICPEGLADLPGLAAGTVAGAYSGPYELAESETGIGYTFALREDYSSWPDFSEPLTGAPASEIRLNVAGAGVAVANQLLSGDLDFAGVAIDKTSRFSEGAGFSLTPITHANVYVLFNQRPGAVFSGDEELRKAVASAIDQAGFIDAFSGGLGPVYTSIAPDAYDCVSQDASLLAAYDATSAARVLDGVTIRMVQSNAFGDGGLGGEFIQESLNALGATVELTTTDNASWATQVSTPSASWDMTIMADVNSIASVSPSLTRVVGPSIEEGGRNFGASDNAEGSALLAEALATTDADAQCDLFLQAQQTVLERADVVPLTGLVGSLVTREGVSVRTGGGAIDFATIRVNG